MAPDAAGALVVQKYGGSSVADAGRITHVARRIAGRAEGGERIVAVVSAMGDTTEAVRYYNMTLERAVNKTRSQMAVDAIRAGA